MAGHLEGDRPGQMKESEEKPVDEQALIVKVDGGLASVVINRPHRRNALDEPTIRRLQNVLAGLRGTEVSALIIAGAGTKAFSAGDDLKALAARSLSSEPSNTTYWLELTDQVEELPFPVIAAIEGYCVGGGLELALACDLRIAGSGAVLALPEVTLNALPSGGATFRLPRVIGLGRAREMIQFGRRLGATEAMEWGLVSEVVQEGRSVERANEVARWLSGISRSTSVRAKALVTFSYSAPSATARYIAALADAIQISSTEFQAGITGFADRDKANRQAGTPEKGVEE